MKKITLLGAAPIDGEMRFPSHGEIEVAPERADELIEVGLAVPANLTAEKVDDLRAEALSLGLNVAPDAKKDDVIAAIRDRRQNKA